jgi:hypothetical protein
MKPRLEPLPLTTEDFAIFARVAPDLGRAFELGMRAGLSMKQDRRDAELMYCIERARQWEYEHAEDFVEHAGMGWVNCLVETALETGGVGFKGSDIIYFA